MQEAMNELKFACPVCGQHITCDAAAAGSQMDCPTCFRRIVTPHAPANGGSKFVLTATEAGLRPKPGAIPEARPSRRPRRFPIAATLGLLMVFALVAGAMVWHDKLFKFVGASDVKVQTTGKPPTVEAIPPNQNWTMNLAAARIPDAPVVGRIHGKEFSLSRATVQGGTLSFRQGPKWPPDLGVTIQLFARQGEDLAGQVVTIDASRPNPPKLTLRWKDDQAKAGSRIIREGYALRLEFGKAAKGRLPGRIYLGTPDEEHSWIAGTFEAEIRKPQPAKTITQTTSSH